MVNTPYQSPYNNWRIQDAVFSVLLFLGALMMLGAAGGNMYSTLINSGEIAYIEQPILAVFISCLSVCAGIAVKAIPMTFTHKESQLLYYKGLFGLTGMTIVVWIYLFASTVASTGGGFSVTDMLEQGENTNSAYTFVQILVEILLGASLFSGWQMLHDSYRPKKLKANPLIPTIDAEIAVLETTLTPINDSVQKAASKVSSIKTARNAFINRQLEALTLFKARHSAIHNLLGDNDNA
ncbi:MAG: hypothetical protein ABJH28_10245 [Paraglaciecola sp.]|uniref:hypothetical protein n=1 Tax=Paraglaciecola sp. TaxID=1920173 RepID=UPI003263E130